jgi:hypothetical protein
MILHPTVKLPRVDAMGLYRIPIFLFGLCAGTSLAVAGSPMAIVEDVSGNPQGVALMDYVEVGKVIELGPQGSIVLSYLYSCQREAIHGGTVKVGSEESVVQSGTVERTKVDCEAGKMMGAVGQSTDSASMIVRGIDAKMALKPAPRAEFTIYGLSPVFELEGKGTLVVARLDKKGEYFSIPIDPKQLVHGAFLDFAADGKSLTAGGAYGARWGGRLLVFKVDPAAKSGAAPIVGRLVRLGSTS